MKKFLPLILVLMFVAGSNNYLQSQNFVGSDACKNCHSAQYNPWIESGHPYKFTEIFDNQPPVYPPEAVNFQNQWMDSLGDGTHDWADIAGVIGGYGWKARFVGTDGVIIGTASSSFPDAGMGHNQFNFYGGVDYGWVDYDVSKENKLYNYGCFKCHTTGGQMDGTWLDNVPGLGTFTEEGIGCESCHGPGGDHINGPTKQNIDRVYEFAHEDNSVGGLQIGDEVYTPSPDSNRVNFLCGTCHNRDYKSPINASGGFIKHHEQWDEFVTTDHFEKNMTCNTCHDPHQRVIWDGEGITKKCNECHTDDVAIINHSVGASCIDCHMPYAAKSGTKRGQSGYVGDVRSHLMGIIPDENSMFTEDGAWVKDDDEREAALSPAYSCMGCHNNDPDDNIPDKTLAQAAAQAKGMHKDATFIAEQKDLNLGLYPNPSTGLVKINFTLKSNEDVRVEIFNTSGQVVYSLVENNIPSGVHLIHWDGTSNTGAFVKSGYYFVKVRAGNLTSVQKVVLMN